MKIFDRKKDLNTFTLQQRKKDCTIGLVPTMGALHSGHISLVKKALSENDLVVVSIFVNPTQFDKKDDLEKYPRTFEKDIDLLRQVSDKIVVFAPTVDEIYEGKVASESYEFEGLDKVMEGEFRSGHFDGVGTIVELLLRTVAPDRAYFGEKDFQQLQIIRKMAEIKHLPYTIVGCPIEREPHGLAMSSRNERLSKTTREQAGFIHNTLQTAKTKFGTESALDIKDWVASEFQGNPLFELEYFEIADEHTLTPALKIQDNQKYRAFIAVYADGVRLIDNLRLN
ncbi:pantoate--beta-alanine ligase [Allomuricauda sp.]|jgi:pantoate--beta-alanine ligase|uniref:pantoate--beta-alanine ligase n=1 Tax=Flagellimonas sp. TaxID=2058762 RepID=UPI001B002BB0|nr:pantoate--beta-alanine ligase [Allomuricauda sp.]MBO6532067.1 pantoate--beta-alanine ligase [Allomuricauda sp.]MBO6587777.1 pantoate--beta-alanine ligase [Allomuricauda sp.]MBO6617402.1 pantoate--beta-alanine ligase [Allomuricauda sp.]MBO6643587.1 pantoate--beta-alanine ligase [Allomuricauda sp.]MBO6745737.1 pantoate--beta-alanine ligase [Allomuricauda sp.]